MDRQRSESSALSRGLKNRHIQLIALGGAIGSGLFLGSAGVLALFAGYRLSRNGTWRQPPQAASSES